nr:reverse transcriptase domain-containing protein [Tanacetum cinerariifolium]
MWPVTQIDTFYNGLTLRHRDTINTATCGTFMKRHPKECYDLIENMTTHHNDWDTSAKQRESSRTYMPREPIKEDLKGTTTRSGNAYQGPTIPTTYSSLPTVVERETEVTKDTMPPTNNGSTKDVQPLVVQVKTSIPNSEPVVAPIIEPVVAPVIAPKPNQKPLIPYPSRFYDQKLRDKANDQKEKFFQIFQDLNFNISFSDALILMSKFGPTIKNLLTNKDKLSELARTSLNEHCSAILLKTLPEKLGDTGKFLIPCDFSRMDECLDLVDLDASINLMSLSVWNKLSLSELSPTCLTLDLADLVDFDADHRVPLILRRSFLKTERALIDVFKGELTLRVGKEAITFYIDQTSRYSANYNDMTTNRIGVIDMACEEYSQEVLGFSNVIASGNPTPYYDLIVSTSSSTLTPFGDSDFLLEEVDAFLALEDDPTSPEVDQSYFDPEGDILLLESFLNDDPSLPPPNQGNYLPQVRTKLKICEAKSDKSSIDEPPEVELKNLSPHLKYAFLEGEDKLPVIIAKDLSDEEKTALIMVLKSHKRAIAWKLSDIKATRKDHFPLPFMDQMLERLAGNEYYCILDGFSVYHPQTHPTHYNQNSSPDYNKLLPGIEEKQLLTLLIQIYDQEPSMVDDDNETSKAKEVDKLMALISLSFKKIYKPTNNNLRTSSNTSRAKQDNSLRINSNAGYESQKSGNVAGAKDTVGSSMVQKSRIQCYNCKEFRHVSRECQKPKREKDAAYHKEKMLLCKQEEVEIQLNAEQADWKDDTDDESDDQELEAHYMYMAKIQQDTYGNKSKKENVLDTMTSRRSIVSNTPLSSNSFAAHRDFPIHRRLWATSSEAWLWHRRLSQLNFDTINLLSKNDIVHDMYVLKSCNGVNSRTKIPIAVPVSTRVPKRIVNQSVTKPLRRTVALESTNQKPRHKTRKLYEHVMKTCGWWYPKFTPPGYNWKPKSEKGNINTNVSMPLGNASRTANILEHMTPRRSTMSNTTLHSNYFAPRRDYPIHHRLWVLKAQDGKSQAPNYFCGEISGYGEIWQMIKLHLFLVMEIWFKEQLVEIVLFIVDSGCSKNMTGNLKLLINFVEKFLGTVKFGNDQISPILGYGDLVQGAITIKRKSTCFIRDLKGNDLLSGSRGTDLYSITLQDTNSPNPICLMAKATSSQAWLVQRGLQAHVGVVRTNKGTKFLNQTLHAYFAAEGIQHQTFVSRTPEQNGVVERRNRTLVEDARTMLSTAKEKGDECIFVGYSNQSRAYRVFNKRTIVIMESIHVNFDELPLMASAQLSSDPAPECQTMALNHDSLSPSNQRQANVVSKSSIVSAADAPNQRQQLTTPLTYHTTPEPTCQIPTLPPTVISSKNINQAETYAKNDQVADDEFTNIFSNPIQDQRETSTRHVDSSNMHTFYQRYPSEHRWTKDHPLTPLT